MVEDRRQAIQDVLAKVDDPAEVQVIVEKTGLPRWLKLAITLLWTGGATGLTTYVAMPTACFDVSLACLRPALTAFVVGGLTSVVTHMMNPPRDSQKSRSTDSPVTVTVDTK